MKRHFSLALLFIALALPSYADPARIVVAPNPATTADSIELRIPFCDSAERVVERSGFTITVTFGRQFCGPINPPPDYTHVVQLGPLPAGDYEVVAHNAGDPNFGHRIAVGSFTVFEADAPFEIHPSVVPTTAVDFWLYIPLTEALYDFCPARCTYRIGGVEVQEAIHPDSTRFIVLPPPAHAPGFADVEISNGTSTMVAKNAVYFFERNAPPDLTVFERVLLPVLFNARGANGSDWQTEGLMSNTSRWAIPTYLDGTLASQQTRALGAQAQYPRGTAVLVPRTESEHVAFALRVRDVSRVAEGFGTEIPVVKEAGMFRGTVTLLDVPLDPSYRVKLRIYTFGELGPANIGRIRGFGTFNMTRSCNGAADCAITPWYTEIDLPSGSDDARANLYVTPPAGATLAWAFASVTNNDTQQVTIVTPDGTGGEPCTPCTIP